VPTKVQIQIKTSQDILINRNTSIENLKERIQFLGTCLGKKYLNILPVNIAAPQEIDFIIYLSNIFRKLHANEGFKRHMKLYNKKELHAHMFVSATSSYICDFIDKLILEPITPPEEGNPDIELNDKGNRIYIECKTINTDKYYEHDNKMKITQMIFDEINTTNQITLFFKKNFTINELRNHILDKQILHEIAHVKKESNIRVDQDISLNVIPRQTLGDKAIQSKLTIIMEDNTDGIRKPGYVVLKNGRSVGVFGPTVDFSKSLEGRRTKSRKQFVKNHPFILAIDSSTILGNPNDHDQYINKWFAPNKNTRYSGIMLVNIFKDTNNNETTKIKYYDNPYARNPYKPDFVNV